MNEPPPSGVSSCVFVVLSSRSRPECFGFHLRVQWQSEVENDGGKMRTETENTSIWA